MDTRQHVYLDVCCLSRLSDEQIQDRVRLEAEAVSILLGVRVENSLRWLEEWLAS
ncbi:MAG TPA: hypothetical protein VNE39_11400 [Planctomycetota bacterium]|nr:hypothetical protein [Planctomycetota bacterium]